MPRKWGKSSEEGVKRPPSRDDLVVAYFTECFNDKDVLDKFQEDITQIAQISQRNPGDGLSRIFDPFPELDAQLALPLDESMLKTLRETMKATLKELKPNQRPSDINPMELATLLLNNVPDLKAFTNCFFYIAFRDLCDENGKLKNPLAVLFNINSLLSDNKPSTLINAYVSKMLLPKAFWDLLFEVAEKGDDGSMMPLLAGVPASTFTALISNSLNHYALPKYQSAYDLHLMSEAEPRPGELHVQCDADGLKYQVYRLDIQTIPYSKLPENFPREFKKIDDIIEFLPSILAFTSRNGHTLKLDPAVLKNELSGFVTKNVGLSALIKQALSEDHPLENVINLEVNAENQNGELAAGNEEIKPLPTFAGFLTENNKKLNEYLAGVYNQGNTSTVMNRLFGNPDTLPSFTPATDKLSALAEAASDPHKLRAWVHDTLLFAKALLFDEKGNIKDEILACLKGAAPDGLKSTFEINEDNTHIHPIFNSFWTYLFYTKEADNLFEQIENENPDRPLLKRELDAYKNQFLKDDTKLDAAFSRLNMLKKQYHETYASLERELKKESEGSELRKLAAKVKNQIDYFLSRKKEKLSANDWSMLTHTLSCTENALADPTNLETAAAAKRQADKLNKFPWGKAIGGALLILASATLIVGSVLLLLGTFGLSAPISLPAFITGVTGLGLGLGIASAALGIGSAIGGSFLFHKAAKENSKPLDEADDKTYKNGYIPIQVGPPVR